MATVQIYPRHSAAKVITYVFTKGKQPGDRVDSERCSTEPEQIIADFKSIRNAYNHKLRCIEAFHVIQSWGPEDSAKLTPEKANELGRKLVEGYFAGHQFTIVTHTDTRNLHNHIVVNPINMETGARMYSETGHRDKLRAISDKLCLEHGLSVIDRSKHPISALNLSWKAHRIIKEGRKSYIFDLAQKAIWSAHFSRSYDEYAAYLGAFGIRVTVESQNIRYEYPGKDKVKRGSKLGYAFDKKGLEEKFKANDEKYAKHPELLAAVRGGGAAVQAAWEVELKKRAQILAHMPKDYGAFTKTARRGRQSTAHESTEKLHDSIIPIECIEKARNGNLLAYCRDNGIALIDIGGGKFKLKGREHVILSATESVNTKNNQHGNLIDFVASHKQVSYLTAIAHITDNPRLLHLAKAFEEPGRVYSSFRIPNQKLEGATEGKKKLAAFLKTRGASERVADELLRHQQAQVEKGGAIHLFPRGEPTGSLEYEPGDDKKEPKKHGQFRAPFFSSRGTRSKAIVFTDPLSFIQKRSADVFSDISRKHGLLVLMEPDAEKVHQYVAENVHVRQLHIVRFTHRPPTKVELDFFENLKGTLAKDKIEVHVISWDQALEREGPSLSR